MCSPFCSVRLNKYSVQALQITSWLTGLTTFPFSSFNSLTRQSHLSRLGWSGALFWLITRNVGGLDFIHVLTEPNITNQQVSTFALRWQWLSQCWGVHAVSWCQKSHFIKVQVHYWPKHILYVTTEPFNGCTEPLSHFALWNMSACWQQAPRWPQSKLQVT